MRPARALITGAPAALTLSSLIGSLGLTTSALPARLASVATIDEAARQPDPSGKFGSMLHSQGDAPCASEHRSRS